MARSERDLFTTVLELSAEISLDWERIEADPVFRTIVAVYPAPESAEDLDAIRAAALQDYLNHYITRERFFREVPSTNGPGTLRFERVRSHG